MKIEINLYEDWLELIPKEIEKLRLQGFKFDNYGHWKNKIAKALHKQKENLSKEGVKDTKFIDDQISDRFMKKRYKDHLLHSYLDLIHRTIMPATRDIKYSSEFSCPMYLKNNLILLEQEIKNGESLFPRLSRDITDARKQDGMLFDWGIQHLHLGLESDKNYKYLIQSTKELVYAIFDEEFAYFIVIADHGKWADKKLLNIVKKDFPQLLDRFKLKGILPGSNKFTEKELIRLRKAGVNLPIIIDGEVYASPGGGINSAGGSMTSNLKIRELSNWFELAENLIQTELTKLIHSLPKEKQKAIDTVELQMYYLENDRITVMDEKQNIRIEVMYNDKRNGFRSTRIWNSF